MIDEIPMFSNPELLLESIRAGIPSRVMLENLPDLRSNITALIDKDLEILSTGASPQGRIVWGEYGQGKTHFLKLIEQHLLAQGYAVSYYSLNRDLGVRSMRYLFPVLASQTRTANNRVPGILNLLGTESFRDDMDDELRNIERQISHPLPSIILQTLIKYKDMDETLVLYNSLMGISTYWTTAKSICRKQFSHEMKVMPKFTIKEHGNSFFEFYPHLLRLLGFKGWVILLDEIELIGKLGVLGRLHSYLNLSYLLNWSHEHKLPLYTIVASAKTLQTDVFFNRYNDVEKIPNVAASKISSEASQIVQTFFANTPKAMHSLVLNPLKRDDYLKLYRNIFYLHRHVFKWVVDADESLIEKLDKIIRPEKKPVRISLRMFIEMLDVFAITGKLLEDMTYLEAKEYDLNEEQDDRNSDGSGFQEMSLEEMFD